MSKLFKKCLKIAQDAHDDQYDKAGKDYILHPLKVSDLVLNPKNDQLKDEVRLLTEEEKEICQCIAILHDVLEDSDYTYNDLLIKHQIPQVICDSVKLLTKDKHIKYDDYLKKLKSNKYARLVKLADLTHNTDLSRLLTITDEDIDRCEKYKLSIKLLL